jgi:hypothetical protein
MQKGACFGFCPVSSSDTIMVNPKHDAIQLESARHETEVNLNTTTYGQQLKERHTKKKKPHTHTLSLSHKRLEMRPQK